MFLTKMLHDRGFKFLSVVPQDQTPNILSDYHKGQVWVNEAGDQIMVLDKVQKSIQIDYVKGLLDHTQGYDHFIVLYTNGFSSSSKDLIATAQATKGVRIECIHTSRLMIDVLAHQYQPIYRKVNVPYRTFTHSPPQLQSDDPIVMWMDWKKGDVVEITPVGDPHDTVTQYRVVV